MIKTETRVNKNEQVTNSRGWSPANVNGDGEKGETPVEILNSTD